MKNCILLAGIVTCGFSSIRIHYSVLQEYWVLTESRIVLKPVLGARELLQFPLVLMNRLNKTESAVFIYFRFSLFLKDPFLQIIYVFFSIYYRYGYFIEKKS